MFGVKDIDGRESKAASGAIVGEGAKLIRAHKYIKIW